MKPVFCKPLPYAKPWRVAPAHPAKAWHLNHSRRDSIVAEEVSAPRSYYQDDDPYSRESLADISTNGRSSTRRRRHRTSPDSSPPAASRYNGSETSAYSSSTANGSSSSYDSGSAYGSSSGYGSGSAYDSPSTYDSDSAYGSNSSTGDSSTDRSQLLNWSHNRSRSRSVSVDRSTRRRSPSPSPERRASSYSAPLTQTVSQSVGGAEVGRATEPHSEASPHQSQRRGRTLRRRQERHRSPAAPEPKPASIAALSSSGATTSPSRARVSSRSAHAPPSSNAGDYGSYRSPVRARSRSRSPSPIPEELAEIKTWLSKDSSSSPAARAAVGSSRASPAPQAIPADSGAAVTESAAGRPASTHSSHSSRRLPAFGSPSAGSMQPAISSTAPSSTPPLPSSPSKLASSSRHRSHSRSPSPLRHSSPDPELEKMKTWLKTHEDDDPLAVKPFELVARGHSPARVSSPERTPAWASPRSSLAKPTPRVASVGTPASAAASAEFSTPTTAADSARLSAATPAACVSAPTKQVATKNGVIDLSNLPASQKHHVREVDVEDLPQTHADYGRALKEMTEVTSVMGWAKAKLEDEHHSVAEVPVLPLVPVSTPVASTSKPESNKKPVGGMSDPALQATTFTCLAAAAAVVSAVALLSPGVMLQVCFSGTPTALEATLARVIGSGVMISAVTNLCLKDAAVHDRLGSATYQRLMGAKVWESVTAGAVLAFHAALCTPMLLALLVPLLGAGAASNCAILSATSGSPLPPRISLSTPANSTALGYTLLSASLLLSAAACLLPLGLIHGSITLHLPLLHHLAASGLLATAIVACVLQDAANRDRLGASTFKTLNLGMAACLGALALSLGAGLKQLLVVPTLVTLPVMALTGAGAVFCLIMFSFSKKPKKA